MRSDGAWSKQLDTRILRYVIPRQDASFEHYVSAVALLSLIDGATGRTQYKQWRREDDEARSRSAQTVEAGDKTRESVKLSGGLFNYLSRPGRDVTDTSISSAGSDVGLIQTSYRSCASFVISIQAHIDDLPGQYLQCELIRRGVESADAMMSPEHSIDAHVLELPGAIDGI